MLPLKTDCGHEKHGEGPCDLHLHQALHRELSAAKDGSPAQLDMLAREASEILAPGIQHWIDHRGPYAVHAPDYSSLPQALKDMVDQGAWERFELLPADYAGRQQKTVAAHAIFRAVVYSTPDAKSLLFSRALDVLAELILLETPAEEA